MASPTKNSLTDIEETENYPKTAPSPDNINKPKENDASLDDKIKLILSEFCLDTSAHGFLNSYKTDSWIIRVIWIILIIGSFYMSFSTIISPIIAYSNYNISTEISEVSETLMPMPAISFYGQGSLNAININASKNNSDYYKNLETKQLGPGSFQTDKLAILQVTNMSSLIQAGVTADCLDIAQKESLGFTLSDMLISCTFNNQPCNVSDFYYFRTTEYGNCYTFNGQRNQYGDELEEKRVSKPGWKNGLIMELFTGFPSVDERFLVSSGMILSVHRRGELPLFNYKGFTVAPSMASSVVIHRNEYYKLTQPFSTCRKDPDKLKSGDSVYMRKTNQISNYTQQLCLEICIQYSYIVPNCSCADPSVPVVDIDLNICYKYRDLECVKSRRNVYGNGMKDKYCMSQCPEECDTIKYDRSISLGRYPTNYYSRVILDQQNIKSKLSFTEYGNDTRPYEMGCYTPFRMQSGGIDPPGTQSFDSQIQDALALVSVYYDKLSYTKIEQSPLWTVDQLIGLIGGQFGLFIGCSICTILEVLDVIANLIRVSLIHLALLIYKRHQRAKKVYSETKN